MQKAALFASFRGYLEEQLAMLERTRQGAIGGTRVDGSHRPTNRGERAAVTGQGYLALGLSKRIQAVRDTLEWLDQVPITPRDRVVTGALVHWQDEDDEETRVLILPGGQAVELPTTEGTVTVLSPNAPLLRELMGRSAGEMGWVVRGGRRLEVEVVDIQ